MSRKNAYIWLQQHKMIGKTFVQDFVTMFNTRVVKEEKSHIFSCLTFKSGFR